MQIKMTSLFFLFFRQMNTGALISSTPSLLCAQQEGCAAQRLGGDAAFGEQRLPYN